MVYFFAAGFLDEDFDLVTRISSPRYTGHGTGRLSSRCRVPICVCARTLPRGWRACHRGIAVGPGADRSGAGGIAAAVDQGEGGCAALGKTRARVMEGTAEA